MNIYVCIYRIYTQEKTDRIYSVIYFAYIKQEEDEEKQKQEAKVVLYIRQAIFLLNVI